MVQIFWTIEQQLFEQVEQEGKLFDENVIKMQALEKQIH